MSAPLFERATASKALAMTTMLCTGAAVYLNVQAEGFSSRRLLSMKTLLTSQTMFRKLAPEMLLGLGLLYVFRQIERVIGTRKFVSYCFVSTTLSITLQLALLTVTGLLEDGRMVSTGPFGPIFSLLVLYFAYIPAIGTPVAGIKINHKLPVYLAGLILATHEGKASLIPSCCAIVAGIITYLQMKKLVMPDWIAKFGQRYIEPLFRSDPFPGGQNAGQAGGRFPRQAGGGMRAMYYDHGFGGAGDPNGQDDVLLPNFFGPPPPAAAVNTLPEPSEEHVATLVAMGFERAAAIGALRRHANDVNRAADSLLSGM